MDSRDAREEMRKLVEELGYVYPPNIVQLAVLNVRMVNMYTTLRTAGLRDLAEEANGILTDAMNMLSATVNFDGPTYIEVRKKIIEKSDELAKKVVEGS